jgi:hypothetical protein
LPERLLHGKKVDDILADKDLKARFDADVGRQIKRHQHTPFALPGPGLEFALNEMRKMVRHEMKRAGLL